MEVPVNKDIREYKVKDIGPFAINEVGWLIVAAVCAYCAFFLTKALMPESTTYETYVFTCSLAAAPAIAFGFLKINGMHFSAYIKTVLIENFVNPKIRPCCSENEIPYEYLLTEEEIEAYVAECNISAKEKKDRQKEIQKNPEYRSYF